MKTKPSIGMFIGLLLGSVSLGLLAFLFAGVPMIVTRRIFGWRPFLFANMGVSILMFGAGLVPFGMLYLVLTLLVAVYAEARTLHLGVARSGLVALSAGFSFSILASGIYLKLRGISELTALKVQMKELAQKIAEVSPQLRLDADVLWSQLPAILALTLIAALTLAVVMESRLLEWLVGDELRSEEPTAPADLLRNFRLPDFFVWLAIVSVLGAFLQWSPPVVQVLSLNAFYVLVFLYFLQGLAVAATYFNEFNVATVWRSIWYVLMIVQLLLVVSLIGFSDYWIDYRERIIKKAAEFKKGKEGNL